MSMCFRFGVNALVIRRENDSTTGYRVGCLAAPLRVNERVMIIVSTIKHHVARCFRAMPGGWNNRIQTMTGTPVLDIDIEKGNVKVKVKVNVKWK